jgi:hypothetical protein
MKTRKRKNPAAVALGRKGGKKGGKARWRGVSADERSAIARSAAKARWDRVKDKPATTKRKAKGKA